VLCYFLHCESETLWTAVWQTLQSINVSSMQLKGNTAFVL